MKKTILLTLFFSYFAMFSQEKETLKVYSFSEVEKLHQQKPKPIVVFIYTDWCKVCFGMKKNTFKNDAVIRTLNNQYYFVKLNAEYEKDITFLGKKFMSKKIGIHELAKELASINGKVSYPTTTILNSKFEIDFQIDSYINSEKMNLLLNKILENI